MRSSRGYIGQRPLTHRNPRLRFSQALYASRRMISTPRRHWPIVVDADETENPVVHRHGFNNDRVDIGLAHVCLGLNSESVAASAPLAAE